MRPSLRFGLVLCVTTLGLAACGLTLDVGPDPGGSGPDGGRPSGSSSSSGAVPEDGGGTSSSSGGSDAGPCEVDPSAPACIVEDLAVFVRAGAASGNGTKASPFGTIAEALQKRAGKSRVYVCAGDYAETVRVSTTALALVGGLDCATWLPPEDGGVALTRVTSAAGAVALDVLGVPTLVQNLTFQAPDAPPANVAPASPGVSSVAAFVHAGATLRSLGAQFVAGFGSDGTDAADRAAAAVGGDGTGAAGGVSTCGVPGGQGGVEEAASTRGQQVDNPAPAFGERGCPYRLQASPAPVCNQGDAYDATYFKCGNGSDGAAGVGGLPPEASPLPVGTLGDTGWLPSNGRAGFAGHAGGGGGGGGQAHVLTFDRDGGGGGAGGCGGEGGAGGGAGGASIGVLVHDASFVADAATVIAAAHGGDGGNGGGGGNGGKGGGGAMGPNEACDGGEGGGGGGGSGGQGGAAGLSAGIVFGGTANVSWRGTPIADTTAQLEGVTVDVAGAAGDGGDKGDGATGGPAGLNGVDGGPGPAQAAQSAFRAD